MTSPCVRLCTLDPETNICVGCGRTLPEIAAWMKMSETERQVIIAALPQRLERYGARAS
jgi:predicted Fe-S protein YdhL (DUF1289 family)